MAASNSENAVGVSTEADFYMSNTSTDAIDVNGKRMSGENGEGHATEHSAMPDEKSAVHKDTTTTNAPHHILAAEAPELGSPCCTDDDEPHTTANGSKAHASQMNDIDAEALERDRRLSDEITSLSLNPLAEEFRPPRNKDGAICAPPAGVAANGVTTNGHAEFYAHRSQGESSSTNDGSSDRGSDARLMQNGGSSSGGSGSGRHQRAGKRARGRNNKHVNMESVRRTVYVCDIENSVTEEQLASLFSRCGQVIDCRICGDPNSALRFAFVEFTTEASAATALMLNGAILNYQQLQVLPSKTPIVPVNPVFLPQSQGELETCSRTIYVTNIDRMVDRKQMNSFFEQTCGPIAKSRLLGQSHHPTRIAFIEFARAESAMGALNCSGAMLGSFPIRVSPSKTPVRLRSRPERNGSRNRSNSGASSSTTSSHS